MCGIAGIIAPDSRKYKNKIERMVNSLRHRGPDDSGIKYFSNGALGHTRLSIIDLSTGNQPMLSAVSNCAITFNGEIYGFKSIKSAMDYPFKTTSDTEVVLALYEKYGINAVKHLPGMFAFGIWDEEKQELFCARDRFGEKPFYYAIGNNGEFIFASEIKAIIASKLIQPVLSIESLIYYLKYLFVHPSRTIYKNVYTLPPAHSLRFINGKISIDRYWDLPERNDQIELVEAIDEFKRLFDRSVEQQLVADVPIGVFLSGGLDSSTVVAVARKFRNKVQTFSFGFGDAINELPYAEEIASLYNTEHIELAVDEPDIGDIFASMQEIYDEPFADSSNIPTYLISKAASRYLKVIITGDGGDEMLGGYSSWYRPLYNMANFKANRLYYLLNAIGLSLISFGSKLKDESRNLSQAISYNRNFDSVADAHANQKQFFSDEMIKRILKSDISTVQSMDLEARHHSNTIDDAMRMDIDCYLPGDILVKIDRAAMANGLELRAPFLDADLASFCISLPHSLKVTRDCDKYLLRKAYGKYWTESVRLRGKKGFGAPASKWLKLDSLKGLKEQYLENQDRKIFSILSFDKTRPYVSQDDYLTWILLVLAIWMEKHDYRVEP